MWAHCILFNREETWLDFDITIWRNRLFVIIFSHLLSNGCTNCLNWKAFFNSSWLLVDKGSSYTHKNTGCTSSSREHTQLNVTFISFIHHLTWCSNTVRTAFAYCCIRLSFVCSHKSSASLPTNLFWDAEENATPKLLSFYAVTTTQDLSPIGLFHQYTALQIN